MTLSASVDTIGKVILIRRYYGSTDVRSIRLRSRHSRTGRRLNYGGKADWLCPFLIVAGVPIPDLDLCSTLRVPHCRSMRYGPHCRQGAVPSQASSSRMLAELLFRFQGMNRHALRKNYVHRLSAGRASHRLPHLESIYRRRLASRSGLYDAP